MRAHLSLILCLLLLPAGRAWSQPQIKEVTFRCLPQDAAVYLEVGTAEPYLLGQANQKLPLDLSLFDGRRNVRVTFRREGWLPETRSLQQEPVQSRFFDSRDRYPEAGQGPVSLTPKGDPASRLLQGKYYARRHAVLLFLGTFGLTLGVVVWRRQRLQLKATQRRQEELDRLVSDVDPDDSYGGRILGEYRLLDRIGRGGMSFVYRAIREPDLKEEVAVKILDPRLSSSEESLKRFRREIAICRELSHPNILRLYDFGEQDGLLYLVMELLKGQTLTQVLDQGIMDPVEVARYVAPLTEALTYLHSKGVVHRDLKPDNIFLTEKDVLKLMDFGIARGEAYTVATATQQGLGTPAYMSPEQVEGGFLPASDQYALGCLVYEMLTGAPPFCDPDPFTVAFKHVGEQPVPLREKRPELEQDMEAAVMRLLKKQPEQRYPSIEEAGRALLKACAV